MATCTRTTSTATSRTAASTREGPAAAAAVHPVARLRPPDLIIQDELHLITGALGTTVGLFEVAIDALTSWRTAVGAPAQPLLVASTATARNAADQVRALYGREVTIFPPQVIDAGRTFFSREDADLRREPGSAVHRDQHHRGPADHGGDPDRRGADGRRPAAARPVRRRRRPVPDAGGYFSATRELAGMARYMGDDIQTALARRRPWSLLPRRTGTDYGQLNVAELTSRVA